VSTVRSLGLFAGLVRRCDRPLKARYSRHERPKWLVSSGKGSGGRRRRPVVFCRACSTPAQQDATRVARRR
jgi:hypothetical protein